MIHLKWLLGSTAAAVAAWKVGSDPRWLHVVLDVVLALILSWLMFVAVFFLTALRVRRQAARQEQGAGWRRHRLRSYAWRVRTHH